MAAAPHRLVLRDADGKGYELDGRPVSDGDQLDLEMEAYIDGRLQKVWRPGRYEWIRDGHDLPRLYLYGCDAIFIRLTPHSVLRWSLSPPVVVRPGARRPPWPRRSSSSDEAN